MKNSILQEIRYKYSPKLPAILREDIHMIGARHGAPSRSESDHEALQSQFSHTYGLPGIIFEKSETKRAFDPIHVAVILSGGQAPGGHNVICGLFDALKHANKASKLFGFKGGPSGILNDDFLILTDEIVDSYRNTGGFDMIGSGRTKLETNEQFARCAQVCEEHDITALVIIGGDDSNTNAAVLAEYFASHNHAIQVVGCPKTIDGDLKNESIEISFGFDTAVKTYSELIGNIERDANSARKYWHFIKLMGRSASHITLECALQTQPTITLISEEIEKEGTTLQEIVDYIAAIVAKRSESNENFGVVLVPEGLIEFIPEMKLLIGELNTLLAKDGDRYGTIQDWDDRQTFIIERLSKVSCDAFQSLPVEIRKQLLMDRDPHGNVQVSRIETERLLAHMVSHTLEQMKHEGSYRGKFSTNIHFFGYEGRCGFPSNFDADYCYSLGYNAFLLIVHGCNGYISSITGLTKPAEQWKAGGVPITMMMNMEMRHGHMKPVIKKALVELEGKPFKYFASHRDTWAYTTSFTYPGAIQYFGPAEVCDQPTMTLKLEHQE
ncbi:MAG: diphosphate--fructose-6-phosphate 1-phosphotransferase [Sphaerochaetaceae bacterium]|mgnify:CR=1 FL=1|jgi:pyrophosphate--fructose-6-phosphate 1-phosphotransferase|nr:diphosphate--fructose-6-phosphate 1-phosphotransferase [Sphaerochaetaceae bacterium]MDD2406580.1 diphosphate--fructose-6-phosphate 1-phosphotransferase [Sphaerochaetaceae bacterium]MDD4259458.1 diphosphate--fructose-6-phosphate 1-phosphotransferase [Sphaerochaetaceae bacterium]MDD4762736.1 diphosphate--fructose-6-phosphate 1-phosphotransferase [Sphaerochaetaceae bacterium]MDD4841467.1 diphosphate--fructose-6-phosphate 1-phosphotransferase [Sphaerochaetaceae bacterium]